MRRSVSSPDETLRREKKYDAQRRIFDELRGVLSGDDCVRGTQREYSSKPLKHSIVERI